MQRVATDRGKYYYAKRGVMRVFHELYCDIKRLQRNGEELVGAMANRLGEQLFESLDNDGEVADWLREKRKCLYYLRVRGGSESVSGVGVGVGVGGMNGQDEDENGRKGSVSISIPARANGESERASEKRQGLQTAPFRDTLNPSPSPNIQSVGVGVGVGVGGGGSRSRASLGIGLGLGLSKDAASLQKGDNKASHQQQQERIQEEQQQNSSSYSFSYSLAAGARQAFDESHPEQQQKQVCFRLSVVFVYSRYLYDDAACGTMPL
jgi:hypothetical protein